MIKAAITGVSGYVPDYRLTNAELEKMVETNDEWIVSRTGIQERRILKDKDKATVYMGTQAAQSLLNKTQSNPEDIELTICCTVTADLIFPDNATSINFAIGATNAYGYDLSAACSGFLYGYTSACHLIESGRYKKILVIGTDKMSSIVNYTDRATCILFGDAAGAILLEPNEEFGLVDSKLQGNGTGVEYLHMKGGGSLHPATHETIDLGLHFAYQEGRPVFKQAVNKMSEVVRFVMQKNNVSVEELDWVVPHQANLRIISSVAKKLGMPMDKVMVNIHKYGNTTAATIPLCLWEWENQLRKGDKIIMTAFGGGFTWGASYFTWAYDS